MKETAISEPNANSEHFEFLEPGQLVDGELKLRLDKKLPADPFHDHVPAYLFHMIHRVSGKKMGRISLRIGKTELLKTRAGQIGYSVYSEYRGNRYAARSCRLLLPLAKEHDLIPLWITCHPDNLPSKKTCELIGGKLVGIFRHRRSDSQNASGYFEKCVYRVEF